MDRVDTRSGNKEGGAPEMVESNPTPTIPDHTPRRGRPKGSVGVRAARVSSDSGGGGGGNNNSEEKAAAAAGTSSRRGPEYSPRKPLQTREERDARLRDLLERHKERARDYFPTFLGNQAGEPAQLAIEYYKKKEGVQLQFEKMILASTVLTSIGFVTHLQFNAMPLSPGGPPTTVYAQIHKRGPFPRMKNAHAHASRVFTHESPLLKDPRFQVDPTDGWIEYPYDCPVCGLDFEDDREGFKVLGLQKSELV